MNGHTGRTFFILVVIVIPSLYDGYVYRLLAGVFNVVVSGGRLFGCLRTVAVGCGIAADRLFPDRIDIFFPCRVFQREVRELVLPVIRCRDFGGAVYCTVPQQFHGDGCRTVIRCIPDPCLFPAQACSTEFIGDGEILGGVFPDQILRIRIRIVRGFRQRAALQFLHGIRGQGRGIGIGK